MKLKKYDTEIYNMINNYIYDNIDTDYIKLSTKEKINIINKYAFYLCSLFKNEGYGVSVCTDDVIIFCIHLERTTGTTKIKWFDYDVKKLLNRKRTLKIRKIKSLI